MTVTILGSCLSCILVIIGGVVFWAIRTKNNMIDRILRDERFLRRLLFPKDNLTIQDVTYPFSDLPIDFLGRMDMVVVPTIRSDLLLQMTGILLTAIGVIVAVVILSWWGAVVSLLFFFMAMMPIGESGSRNALATILKIATVIYYGIKEDPEECRNYVEHAPIYSGIWHVLTEGDHSGEL